MTLQTTVRYGQMRLRGLFSVETEEPLQAGDVCVIRSGRGRELGTVLARPTGTNDPSRAGCGSSACGSCASSQGAVLRHASEEDVRTFEDLQRQGTRGEIQFARQRARDLRLEMKIVSAEYLYEKEKLVLHFTAASRVDFRELVRELAREFSTRIELKQIGARDEARVVGDMASCGRELCCRTFLHDLQPVAMRMAKQQKKTLDPTKISGQCGKLKCCLRYEDEVYLELQKTLPRKNAWVATQKGVGKVLSTDLLLQKLVVAIGDKREVVHLSEVLEQGVEPPAEPVDRPAPVRRVTPVRVPAPPPAAEAPPLAVEESEATPPEEPRPRSDRDRARGERRPPPSRDRRPAPARESPPPAAAPTPPEERSRRRRRRRER